MNPCEPIRRRLVGYLEGELEPKEALQVGRHLQSCSNCKIRLHRERRLKTMLESQMDDPITVDESFSHRVMAKLPSGPPPKRRKHLLRLAAWTLPLATISVLQQIPTFGVGTSWMHDVGRTLMGESGVEILTTLLLGLGRWLATAGTAFGSIPVGTSLPKPLMAATFVSLGGWALCASLSASLLAWRASRPARRSSGS
jgi:predicted anti-sigma-YlaC factor YlaD